ncbi:MAG: ATP-binding protein [Alphaproteobacteria bacterium]|nr:ATP-binding protein [Alphaproteobacteria bacterium]
MPAQIHQADVDLQGLLAVLAENLYSTPEVALRELVQNAHDSIRRRSVESPHAFEPEIRVVTSEPDGVLEIHDTGAGLTDDEVRRFLATIGAGYTRLLRQQDPDAELIGKFGLGFLSAYVVSRRVEVETTSYQTPDRTWRFTSRDGRAYTLEEADARGVGTTVRLHLAPDHAHLANPVRVRTLLSRYGCLLPLPILAPERVNDEAPPWRRSFDNDFHRRKAELGFAQRFEPVYRPLATIPIRPADGAPVHGLVWVQDGASYATSDNRHVSLFVRGMLVTDDARRLLPEWAGFMGAVLQCDELVPTASREDVQRDALFGRVAAHVQESIVAGLRDLAENQTEAWRSIRRRHNEVLRGAALADPRLFSLLEDAITVPTTEGELPLSEVLERSQGRLVMTTGDESGTEEVLFRALSRPVVFGVRYAAAGFVRRYAAKRGVPVVQLGTTGGDRTLFPKAFVAPDVRERLEACFGRDDVEVVPTRFVPRSLPAVLVPDREVALKRRLEDDEADRRIASGLLALARGFTSQIDDGAVARLYVNLDAPLIDALLAAPDEVRGRLTAIVSGLAELTGRTHVEGVSSDLGVVLDRFTEAIVGLAGGVSRERR